MYKFRKFRMKHSFLGEIEFNFTKPDGNVFDTIIFAGENGTGKTAILHALTSITNVEPWTHTEVNYLVKPVTIEMDIDGKIVILSVEKSDTDNLADISLVSEDGTHIRDTQKKHLPMILSNVEINFTHPAIENSTSEDVDEDIHRLESSSEHLPKQIAQLLIDISASDAEDTTNFVKAHPGESVPESYIDIRMKRFNNAFSYMFDDHLKFCKIQSIPRDMNWPSKEIFFLKNEADEIKLNDLSSGEKQVIYRSAFLLRNRGSSEWCPVLIDEPEISMHPKWQEKIYGFYQALFSESGIQKSQIFMATHSDHVIKSALKDENALIIKLKNDDALEYIHKGDCGMVLKTVTLAEVKWRLFDLPTVDFHDELWAELSYDDITNEVKNIATLDTYLVNEAAGNPNRLKEWTGFQADSQHQNGRRVNSRLNTHSLPAYIRNYIHHPEFTDINHITDNAAYTDDELRRSIEFMISCL